MLISFSVQNYRSIKERATFDLLPAKKFTSNEHEDNVTDKSLNSYGISVLKSAVLYGGNASGKSNFLRGLKALEYLVENSMSFKLDESIGVYEPFRLSPDCKNAPIVLEADFMGKGGIRYVYAVEFDQKKVVEEALYFYPQSSRSRKTVLFLRKDGKIKFGTHYEGDRVFNIYDNQLILSQVAVRPIKSLIAPYRFFSKNLFCFTMHDTNFDKLMRDFFSKMVNQSPQFRSNINKLIRAADTEIQEISTKRYAEDSFKFPDEMPEEVRNGIVEKYKFRIKARHDVYDGDKLVGHEIFDLEDESTGTIKLLTVGALAIGALQNGSLLVIDELDKSLHPLLTQMIIRLFNTKNNNPHNAQLIFATHDVSLINRALFRMDQISFAEKDYKGMSRFYRLSEFTNISKIAPLEKWYLLGRFGATPMINEFELSLDLTNKGEYENIQVY